MLWSLPSSMYTAKVNEEIEGSHPVTFLVLGLLFLKLAHCTATSSEHPHLRTVKMFGHQTSDKSQRECTSLNRFISCFQEVEFPLRPETLDEPLLNKQGTQNIVELAFDAFNKSFNFSLFPLPKEGVVLNLLNVTVVSKGKSTTQFIDSSSLHYYHGYLGQASSASHGTLFSGMFDGVLHTDTEERFYMEPATRYFPSQTTLTSHPVAVVYRSTDIHLDNKTSAKKLGLFLSDDHLSHKSRNKQLALLLHHQRMFSSQQKLLNRRKRQTLSKKLRICEISTVSDHTFFEEIGEGSVAKTITEIIYLVTETDEIFRTTDFNGDGQGDNIGFMITNMTIYESVDADDYVINDTDMDVNTLLTTFSTYDFDAFCLALLLTYRDYADGIIGLAWVASSSLYSSPAGICQKRTYLNMEYKHRGYFNLNTGLISMLNFGERIPREVAALTVAHEIGHNFGAPHDVTGDPVCSPGGVYGHFIMHAYSTDADKPNNNKFSSCSIMYMIPVIQNKGSCFVEMNGPVCGNRRVEGGEECDCGYASLCGLDSCCTPPSVTGDPSGCILKDGKACSSSSPCCTETCEIVLASASKVCQVATDCSMESVCNGSSAECPAAQAKLDGAACSNLAGSGTCSEGRCQVAFCEELGLQDCQCSSDYYYQTQLCEVCCQCKIRDLPTCVPISLLGVLSEDGSRFFYGTGQPCDGYQGYCNSDHQCVTMDTEEAINRLKDLFKETSWRTAEKWLQNYWYYIVVAVAVLAIVTVVARQYRKKSEPLNTLAYRTGKMATLWQQADYELEQVDSQLANLHSTYETRLNELDHATKPIDIVVALARMCMFFPSVSRNEVVRTVHYSMTEEFAVRQLLVKGYPIRRLVTTADTKKQVKL